MACLTLLALRSLHPLGPLRALVARRALNSPLTLKAGSTLRPLVAGGARGAGESLVALASRRTLVAFFTLRAGNTGESLVAGFAL